MSDEDPEEQKKGSVGDLVNAGAEIAGGAIGGALGFLAAGPAGAAAFGAGGAAIGLALKHIGEEASKRLLGPREQVRVGGVLAMTAAEVRERLKAGQKVRDDDFFDKKAGGRSDAEEVAESVLLKSQREAEERKLPYMAHLLSNIAFDKSISAQLAHQLTKTAEALTYRQLCLLKIAVFKQQLGLRATNYRNAGSFQKELYQVLYECLDLYTRALVNFGGEVAFGPTDVKPASMTVQGLGADLYNMMSLHKIPDTDLAPTVAQLK